ncbi:polysaccharide biosynthesis tyrosine autokinase [Kordiimonas sp. SCSIO 12603]|uniref:GumC family protein n=1 Tax=Kordiimonas sp. SCSIO 12603 TaxID=2829596 RepID=UPI00210713E1|nr:polysaccharide biosynthesis tyrosine autokinase [Kordiimonas sp. SCSIO 12603]UTW58698.1 polysaccharide biosynthesis tyrosine autokinase [Kordiimonas sp. SCSIO 12603]
MYDNNLKQGVTPEYQSSAQLQPDEDMIDIRALLMTLWRRKWVIVNTAAFMLAIALIILVQLTPKYTASSLLAIESRQSSVVDLEAVMSGVGTDVAAIKTEIDVLKSRRLAGKLVDKLNLTKDSEFNKNLQPAGGLLSLLNPLNYLPESWSNAILGRSEDNRTAEEVAAATRTDVIDAVLKKLSVSNSRLSYSITLSFESESPKKAALLTNTLADLYLDDQLEVKFEATQRANEWLNSRVFDLRQNVRESERKVQSFKESNHLVQTGAAGLVNEQQLAQINSQLIEAKTDLARAEARQEQIRQTIASGQDVSTSGLAEVIQSNLISRLREQEAEVLRRRAELGTRYGPKHPRMKNVEAEVLDINQKIEAETQKIINSISNEAEIAAIRVETLEKNLGELSTQSIQVNRAQVQLRELEREAEANRVLLETFLTRFKETSSQDGLQQADARIISVADVPTEKSFPKTMLILGLAGFAGVGLGIGAAFLLEALDNGYRNFDILKQDIGIKGLGMVPLLNKGNLKLQRPEEYLLSKPTSSFAEAHRNIHASLMFSGGASGVTPRVLGITSSIPGEGKSTVALCFAHILGKSGLKVLVVEADMRRPVLKRRIEIPEQYISLNEVFVQNDEGTAKKDIFEDPNSGVHILYANKEDDPQSLFASKSFELFLREAREQYDMVIVDTPPVMAVSDVIVASKYLDAISFVIQWEKTEKGIVKSAYKQLQQLNVPVAGAILTQVNVKRHQGYGYGDQGYYYGTKSGYYTN